jgi:hypothetical protein
VRWSVISAELSRVVGMKVGMRYGAAPGLQICRNLCFGGLTGARPSLGPAEDLPTTRDRSGHRGAWANHAIASGVLAEAIVEVTNADAGTCLRRNHRR